MRKRERRYHSTNKKTVASLGLMSYDADGSLVFDDVIAKVYEIDSNTKQRLIKDESNLRMRFVYVSTDGIHHQTFLVLYSEDEEELLVFEKSYGLRSISFSALMDLILSIRDQDKEFSLNEYERKKFDLGKYLENKDVEDKFKAISFLKYPISCQSQLFSILKSMELPYIFVVEKQSITKEDIESIYRLLERKYNMKPQIKEKFCFGNLSLMLFSQDEETLDIGVSGIKEQLLKEGFVVESSNLNDFELFNYYTSLGLFNELPNSLVTENIVDAFL